MSNEIISTSAHIRQAVNAETQRAEFIADTAELAKELPLLMGVTQLEKTFGVCRNSIYEATTNGELRAVVGIGVLKISKKDFIEWLAKNLKTAL